MRGGSPCSTRYLKAASVRVPIRPIWRETSGVATRPSAPPFNHTSASLTSIAWSPYGCTVHRLRALATKGTPIPS
jgi:hypothetical protein